VRYEDLVLKPEDTIKSVLEGLGEEFHPNVLGHHNNKWPWCGRESPGGCNPPTAQATGEDIERLRSWQTSQPIYETSIGRWKTGLTQEEAEAFENQYGHLLEQLGYEPATAVMKG
jgi:hypothetical protein